MGINRLKKQIMSGYETLFYHLDKCPNKTVSQNTEKHKTLTSVESTPK